MPKIFIENTCKCEKTKAIANRNNSIPPIGFNKKNTFVAGTFSLHITSNPVLVKKTDTVNPKQTAPPPGPGRNRAPRSIYFAPRGINHYRKTQLCVSDGCNSNSVITDVYKDPLSQCSKESCYDNIIRTVNNVRGKNIDLTGTLTANQTLPNLYYCYDYNEYLKYRKCKYPTSSHSGCQTCGEGVIGNTPYCENRVPYTKGDSSSNPYPNKSFSTNGAVSSGTRLEKLKYDAIRCTPRNTPADLTNNKQCTKYMGTIKYFQDINKKQQVCPVPYALARVRHRSPQTNNSVCTNCKGPCK